MSTAAIGIRAIDHINLTVSDLDRSVQFYQQTFGFQLIEDGRKPNPAGNAAAGGYAERSYVILGIADTAALALHQVRKASANGAASFAQGRRINHWGFVVDDFDRTLACLRQSGVKRRFLDDYPEGVIHYPQSRSVYISDPDGHEIELVERFAGGLLDSSSGHRAEGAVR